MGVASNQQRTQSVETVRALLNVPKSTCIDSKVEGPFALAKSRYLFFEGDKVKDLFFLLNGMMKATLSLKDGDEMVVRFFYPGDVLWNDVFCSDKHTTSVSALKSCTLCSIPVTAAEALICNSEQVEKACNGSLCRLIKEEKKFLRMLAQSNSIERVCCLLLHIFNQQGSNSGPVYIPMSRMDIANYLGLATETVSRIFSRLHEASIINSNDQMINILDYPRLNELARGGCKHKQKPCQLSPLNGGALAHDSPVQAKLASNQFQFEH